MKKRENTGRIALGLLLSGIVFITNLGVWLLTLCALYGLVHLGVIETTGGQVGLPDVLKFFLHSEHSSQWIFPCKYSCPPMLSPGIKIRLPFLTAI